MNQQQAKSSVTYLMILLGILVMISQNFVGNVEKYIAGKSKK